MGEREVVCPWQVFCKDINMYETIKAGGKEPSFEYN